MDQDNKNVTELLGDTDNLPANLLILPLAQKPLFPGLFTPIYITGQDDVSIINQAAARNTRRNMANDTPASSRLCRSLS